MITFEQLMERHDELVAAWVEVQRELVPFANCYAVGPILHRSGKLELRVLGEGRHQVGSMEITTDGVINTYMAR